MKTQVSKISLRDKLKTLMSAIKNKQLSKWFYEFKNGHPTLLTEESNIICQTRFDKSFDWMNDTQIQKLVKLRIKAMYKEKYPNARKWTLPTTKTNKVWRWFAYTHDGVSPFEEHNFTDFNEMKRFSARHSAIYKTETNKHTSGYERINAT